MEKLVNMSSVEAVERALEKKAEVEKYAKKEKYHAEQTRKKADAEIKKIRNLAKKEIYDMKEKQLFWSWGYITVIIFSFLQSGAFQRDVLEFIQKPIEWWIKYLKWFELGYLAQNICLTHVISIVLIVVGVIGGILFIWIGIKKYERIWDDIYKMVFIGSLSFCAVLGSIIRAYIPINLVWVFVFINTGTVIFRKYLSRS